MKANIPTTWAKPKGSVQSTAMPANPLSHDDWFAFIHRIKPIQNEIKPGGVCLNWAMERTLEEAREVLNER